jgi:periplasmic divalent cation tolerance protein
VSESSGTLIVFTTLPDPDTAAVVARELVEQRLAACVHVLAPGISVYRWGERLETASEVTLLIKTSDGLYARIEAAIRGLHPYELPEIIAVPVVRGLPQYLEWVAAETIQSFG